MSSIIICLVGVLSTAPAFAQCGLSESTQDAIQGRNRTIEFSSESAVTIVGETFLSDADRQAAAILAESRQVTPDELGKQIKAFLNVHSATLASFKKDLAFLRAALENQHPVAFFGSEIPKANMVDERAATERLMMDTYTQVRFLKGNTQDWEDMSLLTSGPVLYLLHTEPKLFNKVNLIGVDSKQTISMGKGNLDAMPAGGLVPEGNGIILVNSATLPEVALAMVALCQKTQQKPRAKPLAKPVATATPVAAAAPAESTDEDNTPTASRRRSGGHRRGGGRRSVSHSRSHSYARSGRCRTTYTYPRGGHRERHWNCY